MTLGRVYPHQPIISIAIDLSIAHVARQSCGRNSIGLKRRTEVAHVLPLTGGDFLTRLQPAAAMGQIRPWYSIGINGSLSPTAAVPNRCRRGPHTAGLGCAKRFSYQPPIVHRFERWRRTERAREMDANPEEKLAFDTADISFRGECDQALCQNFVGNVR
jgi:hypothetical protein